MSPVAELDASIIVATRNRAASLARFLSNLSVSSDTVSWELVIVDNGSTDETPGIVASSGGTFPLASVVVPRAGKSIALNEGIKQARGRLLVFTDDDVIPEETWLEALVLAAATNPSANVFGGRVCVEEKDMPRWIRKSYNLRGLLTSEHFKSPETVRYGPGDYPFGPNLAVRASKLEGIKEPWPVDRGPGTALPVGDESAFLARISPPHATDRLFVPGAVVHHEVEPENVSFSGAIRRCYLAGKAHGSLAWSRYTPEAQPGVHPLKVIVHRIAHCRSIREFVCSTARVWGFFQGRRRLAVATGES